MYDKVMYFGVDGLDLVRSSTRGLLLLRVAANNLQPRRDRSGDVGFDFIDVRTVQF